MRGLLERVTRNLVRRGIRDGLLGGNGIWLALGAVAWLVRWLSRTPSQSTVREQIRVGETITVTSVPAPPFGRKARKLKRAARKAQKAGREAEKAGSKAEKAGSKGEQAGRSQERSEHSDGA